MEQESEIIKCLRRGKVYRRSDLLALSIPLYRKLNELVEHGIIHKLSRGLYYYPILTDFGVAPPNEKVLLKAFLKTDNFLVISPNDYNMLGLGTTQLYNDRYVYNLKRHGESEVGGRKISFRKKRMLPEKPTPEFLIVDLVNNISTLAEDTVMILKKVRTKVKTMNQEELLQCVSDYGNAKTKRLFMEFCK